jgi:hypothetical protein
MAHPDPPRRTVDDNDDDDGDDGDDDDNDDGRVLRRSSIAGHELGRSHTTHRRRRRKSRGEQDGGGSVAQSASTARVARTSSLRSPRRLAEQESRPRVPDRRRVLRTLGLEPQSRSPEPREERKPVADGRPRRRHSVHEPVNRAPKKDEQAVDVERVTVASMQRPRSVR